MLYTFHNIQFAERINSNSSLDFAIARLNKGLILLGFVVMLVF
ncbi:hypothetical protein [Nostoc foliaceum]|nr:hypothetical protein [Nostoc foliaceum]